MGVRKVVSAVVFAAALAVPVIEIVAGYLGDPPESGAPKGYAERAQETIGKGHQIVEIVDSENSVVLPSLAGNGEVPIEFTLNVACGGENNVNPEVAGRLKGAEASQKWTTLPVFAIIERGIPDPATGQLVALELVEVVSLGKFQAKFNEFVTKDYKKKVSAPPGNYRVTIHVANELTDYHTKDDSKRTYKGKNSLDSWVLPRAHQRKSYEVMVY